ncbi:acetylornithine deacetylase [Cohaesibacter sp. ES.047]|uniref:acetylornithine deacetylase n=1 Tax=Cohaesibacter sp. ES.047 TaxID=1798205 RepID=UPI000BB9056D|nr:acetylornithine deacetylase [Cohaesibacter sp. ES.047]SNY92995.1 acetylornithine deacetylase [Cohaesibacter sp. ES.047]
MQQLVETTKEIMARLVGFESLSGEPNLDMIDYIKSYLIGLGVEPMISHDETGEKANLFAVIGPNVDGGVLFNGHTDVVPTLGQDWSQDPFKMIERDGRLIGRGTVDMKGFLACSLAMVPRFQAADLKKPILISFCYDEEIGGFGAPILANDIIERGPKPAVAIVGEPTTMILVSGHKAGLELRTEFTGFAAHASDPRKGVNAVEFAARFINKIIEIANRCSIAPYHDSPFEPPYTTFNIGTLNGGVARNITANACALDWELRPMPGEDGQVILAELQYFVDSELLPLMRAVYPDASVKTAVEADVPGLSADESSPAVQFIRSVTGLNSSEVVSFGTDAGHFDRVGISTIVFGPGSIEQAHKPDEYIELSEISNCLTFMQQVADHLSE